MKNECTTDIMNLLAADESLSLGQFNRLLGSKWTQRELQAELTQLMGAAKSRNLRESTKCGAAVCGSART